MGTTVPSCSGDVDRMIRRGKQRADGAGFAQVDGVSADVAEFENPVMSERVLDGEIPLLRVGRYEFSGNHQAKNSLGGNYAWPGAAAAIIWERYWNRYRQNPAIRRGTGRSWDQAYRQRAKRWDWGSGSQASGVEEKKDPKHPGCAAAKSDGQKWAPGKKAGRRCRHLRGHSRCHSRREWWWCDDRRDHRPGRCAVPSRWRSYFCRCCCYRSLASQ